MGAAARRKVGARPFTFEFKLPEDRKEERVWDTINYFVEGIMSATVSKVMVTVLKNSGVKARQRSEKPDSKGVLIQYAMQNEQCPECFKWWCPGEAVHHTLLQGQDKCTKCAPIPPMQAEALLQEDTDSDESDSDDSSRSEGEVSGSEGEESQDEEQNSSRRGAKIFSFGHWYSYRTVELSRTDDLVVS